MKTKIILGGCIMTLLAVASVAAYARMRRVEMAGAQNPERVADAEGNLRVPADYRTAYQFLGIWAVADDKGKGSKEIHVVFASPGAIAAYQKDGHFADGSVLVKEVFETATGEMTTGTVSHPEKLKGWFVMVKDSKNSHPGNKIWGLGWGWSWFDPDNTPVVNGGIANEPSLIIISAFPDRRTNRYGHGRIFNVSRCINDGGRIILDVTTSERAPEGASAAASNQS